MQRGFAVTILVGAMLFTLPATDAAGVAAWRGHSFQTDARLKAAARVVGTSAVRATHAPAPRRQLGPGRIPTSPTTLPNERSDQHSTTKWIVAAHATAEAHETARQVGARVLQTRLGLFVATEAVAARLVRLLKADGVFLYAEPDVAVIPKALPLDPLTASQWWVPTLVPPELVPPVPGGQVVLGISEPGVDLTHPDLQGGHVTATGSQVGDALHGTAVTSAAVAATNELGLVGLWPGAPTRVYLNEGTCVGAVSALTTAADDRVPVINLSYGFADGTCFSHFVATQYAFGLGSLLVAAAGNDYEFGNRRGRPSNDPHVLTVTALEPTLEVASFSNANDGIDLAAPGVGIPVAIPIALDVTDGVQDGFTALDGTSFAAPLVAAAGAWLRAVRTDLTAAQVFQLMRLSAVDLGPPGWDSRTGFGLVSLRNALARSAPADDPLEPNDDIEWIDGRHFARDPALLYRRRTQTVFQRLDVEEDPTDVVAVWMPRRSRLRLDVVPLRGNVDLEVFTRFARTIFYRTPPRTLVSGSYRTGSRRETLFVDNSGPSQVIYVATFVPTDDAFLDASYRLILRRSTLPRAIR